MTHQRFETKRFLIITLITSIWVQLSETFRYFVFVVPRMNIDASQSTTISIPIFAIWMLWGTILTALTVFLFWMYAKLFGNTLRTVLIATSLSWTFFFVLFWIGISNMGLSEWNLLWITLPLSWLELFIATYITSKLYAKHLNPDFALELRNEV